MELQDPRAIKIDGPQMNLLEQVTETGAKIASSQPFSSEISQRLRRALLPDRVVASLNMEGINATRRATLQVMDVMRIEETASRAEHEVLNLLQADEFIYEAIEDGSPISPPLIRRTQQLITKDVLPTSGAFRTGPVELPGAPYAPPPYGDVPSLVESLCERFRQAEGLHPLVQAAYVHGQFTMIHPFDDGNGRTGRLLQDWTLMRRGMFPTGIPTAYRDDYYAALEQADQGDWSDLIEMLATLQLTVMAKVEATVREPGERAEWVAQLAQTASTRFTNTRHRQYLVWRQRAENLAREFEVAASDLRETSDVIGVTFRAYPGLEFAHWQDVADRGSFTRTWQFGLLFFAERQPVWKAVFYARRHQFVPCDPIDIPHGTVALYLAGQAVDVAERLDIVHFDDPHVTLRELVYVDDELYRYRLDAFGELVCDANVSPTHVVRDFFRDVFGRKMGLDA